MKYVTATLLIAILIVLAGCGSPPQVPEENQTVYFTISDPGNVLEGVTELDLTISKISIHNQDTDEWVDVSTDEQTFDLLQLNEEDVMELAAEANLTPGNYNQIRVDTSDVMVTYNDEEQEVKLPSDVLKINTDVEITNESVLLNFDFLANESLHATGEGKIIMTPVINLKQEDGVQVQKEGKRIKVTERVRERTEQHGMDINGNMEKGVKVREEAQLEIGDDGKIMNKGEDTGNQDNSQTPPGPPDNTGNDDGKNKATGQFTLLVSDAPADIADFDYLKVTFSKARVFKQNEKWEDIDISGKTADLTQLVGEKALPLITEELEAGTYTKIELYASTVDAKVDNETADVKIPSGNLKITKNFEIVADQEISFVFDINVVKTGQDLDYNLLPVISKSGVAGEDVNVTEVDECEADDDCEEGYVCSNEVCVEGNCLEDSDCEEGYECNDNTCEEIELECEENSDCEEGFECVDNACQEIELECEENSDCDSGYLCVENECAEQEVTMTLEGLPSNVTENDSLTATWTLDVNPEATITSTALYYDTVSHSETFDFDTTPADAGYANTAEEYTNSSETSFNATIEDITQTIYMRAYALINGYNYWTEESTVEVVN